MRELLTARNATIVGAALFAAYEAGCPDGETISEGADRLMMRRPLARAALGAIGLITTAHITNTIPERWDPFHYALAWKKTSEV